MKKLKIIGLVVLIIIATLLMFNHQKKINEDKGEKEYVVVTGVYGLLDQIVEAYDGKTLSEEKYKSLADNFKYLSFMASHLPHLDTLSYDLELLKDVSFTELELGTVEKYRMIKSNYEKIITIIDEKYSGNRGLGTYNYLKDDKVIEQLKINN